MKFSAGTNLPKKAVAYAGFSLVAVLAFCLMVIIPNAVDLFETDRRINATAQEIEKQKLLVPLFLQLTKTIQGDLVPGDALTGPKQLSQEDVVNINDLMGELAAKASVTLGSAIANPDSLDKEMRLSIRVVAHGELDKLREFLALLGRQSYLAKIERVTLSRKADGPELAVTVWAERK